MFCHDLFVLWSRWRPRRMFIQSERKGLHISSRTPWRHLNGTENPVIKDQSYERCLSTNLPKRSYQGASSQPPVRGPNQLSWGFNGRVARGRFYWKGGDLIRILSQLYELSCRFGVDFHSQTLGKKILRKERSNVRYAMLSKCLVGSYLSTCYRNRYTTSQTLPLVQYDETN